jgi:hypothetical protein
LCGLLRWVFWGCFGLFADCADCHKLVLFVLLGG